MKKLATAAVIAVLGALVVASQVQAQDYDPYAARPFYKSPEERSARSVERMERRQQRESIGGYHQSPYYGNSRYGVYPYPEDGIPGPYYYGQ